jgi:hypothetical protein
VGDRAPAADPAAPQEKQTQKPMISLPFSFCILNLGLQLRYFSPSIFEFGFAGSVFIQIRPSPCLLFSCNCSLAATARFWIEKRKLGADYCQSSLNKLNNDEGISSEF